MRLTGEERKIIKKSILLYDKDAKIYLFGSRTDTGAKGGDIDVLILSDKLVYENKLAIKTKIFCEIEEQKIDLILAKNSDESPFVRMIFKNAVLL